MVVLFQLINCDDETMKMSKFLSKVIKNVNDMHNCIYYVFDDNIDINDIIEKSIDELNVPVIVTSKDQYMVDCEKRFCNTYVLICDYFDKCVNDYLRNETNFYQNNPLALSKILMFLLKSPDYQRIDIKKLLGTVAYDIVIVDGFDGNENVDTFEVLLFISVRDGNRNRFYF